MAQDAGLALQHGISVVPGVCNHLGTAAYALYQGELGVRLDSEELAQTGDIDFASFERLSVVLGECRNWARCAESHRGIDLLNLSDRASGADAPLPSFKLSGTWRRGVVKPAVQAGRST